MSLEEGENLKRGTVARIGGCAQLVRSDVADADDSKVLTDRDHMVGRSAVGPRTEVQARSLPHWDLRWRGHLERRARLAIHIAGGDAVRAVHLQS